MACCLTAPSHYLNQCWLLISEVQWHIREISQEMPQPSIIKIHLKITYLKFHSNSSGATHTHVKRWESGNIIASCIFRRATSSGYETVCAKAPARPPHINLAGIMRTLLLGSLRLGLPNVSGNVSKRNDFMVSKPKNDRPAYQGKDFSCYQYN